MFQHILPDISQVVVLLRDRKYPRFPIPGVGAIVVSEKGILLTRRDKDPGRGMWSIPGGAVEVGETQRDAVVREIFEETGVRCEVIRLIDTYDLIIPDEEGKIKFHYVLIHFLSRALNTDLHEELPDVEVSWFNIDNLPVDETPELVLDLINSVKDEILEIMNS